MVEINYTLNKYTNKKINVCIKIIQVHVLFNDK